MTNDLLQTTNDLRPTTNRQHRFDVVSHESSAVSSAASGRRGQAMILAVMSLGGAILGATTIAGFLMVYQVRQTTDLANSAKAIFAADAGVECALYNQFHSNDCTELQTFAANGASFDVKCFDTGGALVPDCSNANASVLFSVGTAATARRAFSVQLGGASQIFP
jgi:hypothetical protein